MRVVEKACLAVADMGPWKHAGATKGYSLIGPGWLDFSIRDAVPLRAAALQSVPVQAMQARS